ncbi:tetratricopeptide repeat protein [Chitinophagaceae bacterium LWZ2-11]
MIGKQLVLLAALFMSFSSAKAEKVYDFNSTCQQAYREITQLKLTGGIALIEKAKQQNPDNLIPLMLENYVDFFVLFLNEDPKEYEVRKPKFAKRIEALEQGPQSSPFYKFCLSAVYLQRAAVAIKFTENWRAGWDLRKAYQLIKQNAKDFPTFAPNDMVYGGLQAIVSTIPSGYTFLAGLLGMKGSVSEGMKLVHSFAYSSDPYARLMSNESAFLYCYLLFYIDNKRDDVFTFIQNKKLDLANNYLLAYMAANLALNNKQTEYSKSIVTNRNKSPEYLTTGVWDYELGFAKLYHLEIQDAAQYFETYIANFKGKFYVKDVYQKLSWCYYLQGNMQAAEAARNNVLKKGSTDSDADKQALKDAKSGVWPNALLLKARLLNDGGYNNDALGLLAGKNIGSFSKDEDKLEYTYRLARIYDDMHKDDDAIKAYQSAITLGADRKEYYAARAAWQIAQIYERQGKKAQAISYYEKCMNMPDHEYKNSLDQKAKSGIARCKGE